MAVACGAEPSARDAVDVVVQEQLVRCTAVLAGQKKNVYVRTVVKTHVAANLRASPCFFFFGLLLRFRGTMQTQRVRTVALVKKEQIAGSSAEVLQS